MTKTKCPFCKLNNAIKECWKHFSVTSIQSAQICQKRIVNGEGIEHTCPSHRIPGNILTTMQLSLPSSRKEADCARV